MTLINPERLERVKVQQGNNDTWTVEYQINGVSHRRYFTEEADNHMMAEEFVDTLRGLASKHGVELVEV